MLKYVGYDIVFRELPDETTLAINLSNCPCYCKGCHSSYLAGDVGEILTISKIESMIESNKGITAICFMGGDNDPKLINHYASVIRKHMVTKVVDTFTTNKDINLPKANHVPAGSKVTITELVPNDIKVGWYSGRQELSPDIDIANFDYIKLGPYKEECGPLDNPNTNQRLYKVRIEDGERKLKDITHKFWNKCLE